MTSVLNRLQPLNGSKMNYELRVKNHDLIPKSWRVSSITAIRMLKTCVLLFSIFCLLTPSFAQDVKKSKEIKTIDGKKYYIHTVEKGQTLYAIAHAYDLKVNDIVIENPDAIDGIKPGQSLKIPFPKEKTKVEVSPPSKSDSAKYYFHQVQQGETFYSLSKFYDISIDKIKELNPEVKDGLKVTQVIKIPADKGKTKHSSEKTSVVDKTTPDLQKETAIKKETSKVDTTTIPIKSDAGKKKNDFNVALFLPFHISETLDIDIDKIAKGDEDLPGKTSVAIQFYQGAQMAIDSLKKSGFSAKLHVYDIDEKDSVQLAELLKKPELLTMDLMVGPLYSSNFVPLSKYAKENKIFITSPVSQQNKILFNNPYVSKVTASVTTQTEEMADYIAGKYKADNIVVVNSGIAKDAPLVKIFLNRVNELLHKSGTDSVSECKGFGGISNFIHSTKTNVVVVPSGNQTFVSDFITKLNGLREKNPIILFGMQSWNDFDNLDLDYLSNMQFHYPSATFINYDSSTVKLFVRKYADQHKTDPGAFVFQGFDVMYFYLDMLRKYGFNFQNKLATTKQSGLQTSFEFYQVSAESGFENKAVYMLMFQDRKLIKAN